MATDPEFRLLVLEAEGEADDQVHLALYKRAIEGDVAAQKFWLRRRKPDEWRGREPAKPPSTPSDDEMRAEGYRLIREFIDQRDARREATPTGNVDEPTNSDHLSPRGPSATPAPSW